MDRKLTVISCVLWILGITVFIVGLNLEGAAGTSMTIAGNVSFLVGLGLQGVLWVRKQKQLKAQQIKEAAGSTEPAGPTPPKES